MQAGSPLALVVPTFTEPSWTPQLGLLADLAARGDRRPWGDLARFPTWSGGRQRLAACGHRLPVVSAGGRGCHGNPTAEVREETALRGDLDVLWRFDGNRFRTLDYQTMGRTTAERLRELTTIEIAPTASQIVEAGYTAGPFNRAAWFVRCPGLVRKRGPTRGRGARGDAPTATFGRAAGVLPNPTTMPFDLPVGVRRLIVRVSDRRVAADVTRIEIVPDDVVSVERTSRRPGPQPRIAVWQRSARTSSTPTNTRIPKTASSGRVEPRKRTCGLLPAGASRMTLTLSTGPMAGDVTLSVAGKPMTVAMTGGEVKVVSFELPPGQRLVPVTVQSSVMFRPAEIDPRSTDMRGLGCQVRIGLE